MSNYFFYQIRNIIEGVTYRQNVMVPSSRSIRQLTMSPAAHDWGKKTAVSFVRPGVFTVYNQTQLEIQNFMCRDDILDVISERLLTFP